MYDQRLQSQPGLQTVNQQRPGESASVCVRAPHHIIISDYLSDEMLETRTRFIHEHKLSFVVLVVELNPLNLTSRYSQTLIKLRIYHLRNMYDAENMKNDDADVGGDSLQTS